MNYKRTYFFFFFFFIYISIISQNISYIKLLDGDCYPLQKDDNGISFEYYVLDRGTVDAYLSSNNIHYNIFNRRIDYPPKSTFTIPTDKIKYFFESYRNLSNPLSLDLIHRASKDSKYSEKKIMLSYKINAPYGKKLKKLPTKPSDVLSFPEFPDTNQYTIPMYPIMNKTDFTKIIENKTAKYAIYSGIALIIGGYLWRASIEKENQLDKKQINTPEIIMGAGAVISFLGFTSLYEKVPDNDKNDYNKRVNDNLISKYESESKEILEKKRNLIIEWNNRIENIKRSHQAKFLEWQNEYEKTKKINELIIQTYSIKFKVIL